MVHRAWALKADQACWRSCRDKRWLPRALFRKELRTRYALGAPNEEHVLSAAEFEAAVESTFSENPRRWFSPYDFSHCQNVE